VGSSATERAGMQTAAGPVDQTFSTVAAVARALRVADARLQPTLDAVVSTAAATTGYEAGLVLVSQDRLILQATSGRAPHELDRIQQRLGAGPCYDAAQLRSPIVIEDTGGDRRWPGFCARAAALGVRSMLCMPLQADERCLGSLSLFADRPTAFDRRDEQVTALFATLAGLALADALRTEQLHAALSSRDLIGQAKGILMERHKITAAAAFGRLTEQSQRRNVKLAVVARHLVETGELLGGSAEVQRAVQ
jgi:GAF domain-containing protein